MFDKFISQLPSAKAAEVTNDIEAVLEPKEFKKNTLLYTLGNPCHHLYLVQKGLVRSYYLKDGKNISCYFAAEGRFITAINSLFKPEPSQFYVETIEDCSLIGISFKALESLLDKHPILEKAFRIILSEYYTMLIERTNLLQFYTAKEKYDHFVKNDQELFQRLPLGHIASYLGISQETLSRIRAQR